MLGVEIKTEIKSRCGIDCSECRFMKEKVCNGCINIKKPFWADTCAVKECCESKKIECCGKCEEFACNLFGVRIDIWTHFMRECIINYVH